MKETVSQNNDTHFLLSNFKKHFSNNFDISDTDNIIVGVSGGSDSLCLLHLLSKITNPRNIFAIYVNHNLRPEESVIENQHISCICSTLQIPYKEVRVDVPALKKQKAISTEDAARILRYRALEKIRQKHQAVAIAVGHTADDQVEEFLIRLIRGSNTDGLSGMSIKNNYIIRPLLHEKKITLVRYLQDCEIGWCHDSSNDNQVFLRNKIRHDLLPHLESKYNPSIRTTILQTSDLLKHEDDYLEQITTLNFSKIVSINSSTTKENPFIHSLTINTPDFLMLHTALQRRTLEKCCWKMRCKPTFRLIGRLLDTIITGVRGAEIHLKNGVRAIKKENSILFFKPEKQQSSRDNTMTSVLITENIEGDGYYFIPEINKTFHCETHETEPNSKSGHTIDGTKLRYPLTLRSTKPGEKFSPFGLQGRKKISRFLSDKKILKQERYKYLVLTSDEDIVAIPGLQIDERFKTSKDTKVYLSIRWF